MPINDSQEFFSQSSGTHWTLLIYEKKNEKFIYFDSAGGGVNQKVNTIAQRVKSLCKND